MDASLNFQAGGGKKVTLPGTRGSISDDIMLENCNGNVVVGDIKKDNAVLKKLGLSKGDELLGATIYFDNLNKNEVMDILKAAEPYKTGLQLHVKNDAKTPDMVFTAPSFNLKNEAKTPERVFTAPSFNVRADDLGLRDSAYESLFNNKIKRHLKAAKSLEDLTEPGSRRDNMKSAVARFAERHSVDLESPKLDIHGGDLNTGISVPGKPLQYKSPSLSMDLDTNSGLRTKTDVSGKIKTPEIDISVPKIKGTFKGPEVNMDPAFTAPSIKMPAVNMPEGKISVHENDLHLRAPEVNGNIHIKDPKLKGDFKAPSLDIAGPNVNLKGSDTKVSSPHFKLPSFGLSDPSVKAPKFDGSMETPSLDISLPKVEGDFKAPAAKVDLPDVDVKGPKFKMPSLGIGKAKAGIPDADLKVHSPNVKGDFDINLPKFQTNNEGPSIGFNGPDISLQGPDQKLKGPNFKMPSIGVSGPSIKSPELNSDIKTPSLDMSLPKLDGNFKAPDAKVDLPSLDVKVPKVKMPSFGKFNTNATGPDVDLNLKHPEIKGDIDIPSPKLKANIEGPDLDINAPNINLKGPEKKIKAAQFKMPSFGISGPSLKTPDFNVDGNIKGPEVDVSVPKVKGDFKGPEFGLDLPDANISAPKIKMPSVDIPSVDLSLPEGGLNVKAPNIKGDINIKDPKLKGDIKVPNLDVKAPDINVKGSGKKVSSPHFKMPSFGMSGLSGKTPKLDGNLETSSLDVSLPKVEGELKAPTAKVDLPSVEGKSPTFKMPSMGIFNRKPSISDVNLNVKSPDIKSDIDLTSPKLKANIEGPDVDINAPNISLKGPEKKIKGPQFKMPSFGITGPNVKTPDIDVDGNIKGPELDVSVPKVKGKFKAPEVGVDLPDAEIKTPKITMPSVDIPSANLSLPEGGLNVKAPELKGDIKAPKIDIEAPNVNLKKPHFKMPSFKGFGSSTKSPELDVSVPQLEGDIKGPSAKLDVPNVEAKGPKFKMPSLKMFHPKTGIPDADLSLKSPGLKGDLYVPTPKLQGDLKSATLNTPDVSLKMPEKSMTVPAKIKGPDINLDLPSADVKGPKFKMPSFGMPNVKAPKVDGKITTPSLDVSLPKVDANLKSPSVNVDHPNVEAKGPKFKMPSMGIFNAKGGLPEADLNVKSPEMNADIDIPSPKLKASFDGPDAEISAPNINLKGPEKFKGPQFKMPSFGMSGPSLKTPDINLDSNIKGPKVDVSAPNVKGKFKGPEFDVDLPDANITAPKMKMPSVDIPSVDLSLPEGGLNVKAPELKVDPKMKGGIKVPNLDVEVPDINMKGADKKGFSPHFKMPSFGISPKLDGNLEAPSLDVALPKIEGDLKAPSAKVDLPSVDAKGPHFKMPSFGISGPSVETPKLHGNLETPSLDVSLPKIKGDLKAPSANVDLPSVDAKGPSFKMPSFGLFNSKGSVPDVDLNVKSPELKGEFDVPSPKLKTSFEGPDLDINAPNINLKGSEKKIKGPQFKMPSFGKSGPSLKTPDINIDGNMKVPEVDVTVPKVKGKVKAPVVDMDLPNAEIKAPKISMPSVDIPSVDLSLPKGGLNVKAPELKGDININNPKLKGDIKVPNLDINAPDIKVKSPEFKMPSLDLLGPNVKSPKLEGNIAAPSLDVSLPNVDADLKAPTAKGNLPNLDAKGPKLKMPSLNLFQGKTEIPDIDLSMKSPKLKNNIDISTPNVKGPSIEVSGPKIDAPDLSAPKLKGPEINVDVPKADTKSSKFKLPSFKFFQKKGSHDIDVNVKSPELSSDVTVPKLQSKINTPEIDLNTPNINVKKSEKKINGPQLNMPSFGISGPNINAPNIETDGKVNERGIDVSMPEAKGTFKSPDVNVTMPSANITDSKFKLPSLNFSQNTPDANLTLKTPQLKGDAGIKVPKMEGNIKGPQMDINVPNIDVKKPEAKIDVPKFKVPSFGNLGSSKQAPDFDVTLPSVEGKLESPAVNARLPNIDVKNPNIDMANIKGPNIDIAAPDISLKRSQKNMNLPDFNSPSVQMSGSAFEMPKVNTGGKIDLPGVDVDLPSVKNTFRGPEINVDPANVDIALPKFKTPSASMSPLNTDVSISSDMITPKKKILVPDIDINLESPVDLSVPELKGQIKGPHLDINAQKENPKSTDKKGSGPQFKFPLFDITAPNVKAPEVKLDSNIKSDIEATMPKAEVKGKGPSINMNLPNVGVHDKTMKAPSIPGVHIKSNLPDAKLNLGSSNLECDIDAKVDGPEAVGKDSEKRDSLSWFKKPLFGKSKPTIETPEVNISSNMSAPKLESAAPKLSSNEHQGLSLEKNLNIPDVNLSTQLRTPEIGVSVPEGLDSPKGSRHQNSPNKKGKGSQLKFPFDFSGIPDIDFAFSPPKQSTT